MSRSSILKLSPLGLLLFLPLVASSSSAVGAPWISVEMPANPLDRETRDAAFLVHVYFHENPARFPVSGSAQGLVNGRRESVSLEFEPTSRAGVYAVRRAWPAEGHWVVTAAVSMGDRAGPCVVLELGPDGGVVDGRHYQRSNALAVRSVRVTAGTPDNESIDAALQALTMTSR